MMEAREVRAGHPPSLRDRRRRLLLALVMIAAVGLPMATVVLQFPPEGHSFYPPCFWYLWTGWYCPGCGATRCVGALLRGEVLQALAYNALLILILPLLAIVGLRSAVEEWTGQEPRWGLPGWVKYAVLVLALLYGVLRNLPWEPFARLAPHALGSSVL